MVQRAFAYITFRVGVTFGPVVFSPAQHRGDLIQVAETRFRFIHSDEGDLVIPCLDERVKDVVDLEDTNRRWSKLQKKNPTHLNQTAPAFPLTLIQMSLVSS